MKNVTGFQTSAAKAVRWEREELEWHISHQTGRNVALSITDNVRSMMSFRLEGTKGAVVRLHHMFLDAPDDVVREIASWIKNPRVRSDRVRQFMEAQQHRVRPAKDPLTTMASLHPEGRVYNLHKLFARLNARFFDSRLEMRVTWGNKIPRRRVSSMKLGSYCLETGVITISQRLDHASIPEYFVEFVLYHEMLHAAVGIQQGPDGRRRIHTSEFNRLERMYPYYEQAMAYEKRFMMRQ